jgi:hypothetical protein
VSIPRKHHYSPVFYLKRWAGTDGWLCEHKRLGVVGLRDRIVTRRTFPTGTGYEKDLYRVGGYSRAPCPSGREQVHAHGGH